MWWMVAVFVLAACGGGGSKSQTVHITYQMRGFATSPTVTYRTANGSITKHVGDPSNTEPVNEDIGADITAGDPVSLTVQSTFLGDKEVTCIIVGSKGQTIAQNTAQGQMVTASCDGKAA
jgi:hypothetical protein